MRVQNHSTSIQLDWGRTYRIHVGVNLCESLGSFLRFSKIKTAVVIYDRRLEKQKIVLIRGLKKASWKVDVIPVSAGESLKELRNVSLLFDKLVKLSVRRDSVIFALGGGSVGDAVGFVASTYLRGVPWVGVPTTLLAQVDSSIGGKTAVNHKAGKNLIGTFHQPRAVIADIDFLATLAKRDLISGLGEVIKTALVFDQKFFEFVRAGWGRAVSGDKVILTKFVKESVKYKALAVERDEFDKKGFREFLNFGHTFGHALESLTAYKKFRHGEAVIWGMRFALALSFVEGTLTLKEYEKADDFLRQISLPPIAGVKTDHLIKTMSHDKKVRNGKLHFVLLSKIGRARTWANVGPRSLKNAYKLMIKRGRIA